MALTINMKTSLLYLIVTGQIKATSEEAALIMQAVHVAQENLALQKNNPSFDYKDILKNLETLTAQRLRFF